MMAWLAPSMTALLLGASRAPPGSSYAWTTLPTVRMQASDYNMGFHTHAGLHHIEVPSAPAAAAAATEGHPRRAPTMSSALYERPANGALEPLAGGGHTHEGLHHIQVPTGSNAVPAPAAKPPSMSSALYERPTNGALDPLPPPTGYHQLDLVSVSSAAYETPNCGAMELLAGGTHTHAGLHHVEVPATAASAPETTGKVVRMSSAMYQRPTNGALEPFAAHASFNQMAVVSTVAAPMVAAPKGAKKKKRKADTAVVDETEASKTDEAAAEAAEAPTAKAKPVARPTNNLPVMQTISGGHTHAGLHHMEVA